MDVVTTPKLSRNPEQRIHSLNMTGRSMPSAEQNKATARLLCSISTFPEVSITSVCIYVLRCVYNVAYCKQQQTGDLMTAEFIMAVHLSTQPTLLW
jgi:hypothetical protein